MTLLPRRIESSPQMPNATSGSVRGNASDELFMGSSSYGSAQNNYGDYSVLLEAGTYTLTVIYFKWNGAGICEALLDGVSLGTQDFYTAGASKNQVWTITGITVATTGVKTLRFQSTTKNASSSAYWIAMNYWSLQRTDATTATGTLDYTARHIDICPWVAWTETGATFARAQGSTALGGGWLSSSEATSDDGDSVSFYAALAAGTWSLTYIFIKNIICPKVDVFVGATKVVSAEDWYAGTLLNNVSTVTGISVAADGVYEIKFQANGKNVLSADYVIGLQWLTLQKTA